MLENIYYHSTTEASGWQFLKQLSRENLYFHSWDEFQRESQSLASTGLTLRMKAFPSESAVEQWHRNRFLRPAVYQEAFYLHPLTPVYHFLSVPQFQ